jgi:hypothetical protein
MSSAGSDDAPATTAEVRPGAGKAARFSASVQSTSWFARLPAHAMRDLLLPKTSERAILVRNSPESGECRIMGARRSMVPT